MVHMYTDIAENYPVFYIKNSQSLNNRERAITNRTYTERKTIQAQIFRLNWDNVTLCEAL